MKTKKYEIHPLAETYPPMSEPEMEALTTDIAERGLQRPIVLFEGKILDGRNRFIACQKADVEPRFEEYEGDDPLGQVNSLNLNRDLKAGQRAMVAAKQWMECGDTKGSGRREKSSMKTLSIKGLAKQFRVSDRDIGYTRDLLAEAPDLAEVVQAGSVSIAEATQQLQERRAQSQQTKKDAAKVATYDAQFAEAIADGQMTPGQALLEISRREREEREKLERETEARQIWFEHLTGILKWLKEWAAIRDDDELAWIIDPNAAETGYSLTQEEIGEGIEQLRRIAAITPGRSSNGRGKRSHQAGKANP